MGIVCFLSLKANIRQHLPSADYLDIILLFFRHILRTVSFFSHKNNKYIPHAKEVCFLWGGRESYRLEHNCETINTN